MTVTLYQVNMLEHGYTASMSYAVRGIRVRTSRRENILYTHDFFLFEIEYGTRNTSMVHIACGETMFEKQVKAHFNRR